MGGYGGQRPHLRVERRDGSLLLQEVVEGLAAVFLGGADPKHPLASPLYADLRGLPPLYIQVGGDETLLERYVRAWEGADLDGFVALLREDAVLSMPPWQSGTSDVKRSGRSSPGPGVGLRWALPPRPHCSEPAAGLRPVRRRSGRAADAAHALRLLALQDDAIAVLTGFVDPRLFAAFGLPAVLPTRAQRCPDCPGVSGDR